ncbi:glutaredoxin family protein [Candidatus Pacearchaeota archaeon]|nr:glutaredoxin family protein [Candidatus Pacearchaeota archaeon]
MTVKIYSTPSCHWCHKTKDFFNENNVEFTDIDVTQDQDAAKEMVEKSGQMGVPVIDINGEIIVGFKEPLITDLLKLK